MRGRGKQGALTNGLQAQADKGIRELKEEGGFFSMVLMLMRSYIVVEGCRT